MAGGPTIDHRDIPAPIAVIDAQGRACLNPDAVELLGADGPDVDLVDRVRTDDRERLRGWLADLRSSSGDGGGAEISPLTVTLEGFRPGRIVTCTGRLRGDDLVVAFVDVSEYERARITLDEIVLGVTITEPDGLMIWRHRRRDEPHVVEESVGQNVVTRIHPDDHAKCLAVLEDLAKEPGSRRQMVLRIRPPGLTGAWFPLRITSVSLENDPVVGGVLSWWEPPGGGAQGSDLDRAVLAWDVVQSTSEGLVFFSPQETLRFRNRRARTLLGEDVGLDGLAATLARVDPEHRELLAQVVEEARAGITGQCVVHSRAGDRPYWLRITVVPDVSHGEIEVGVVFAIQDVTDEVEATEELRQARDELWHLAHHDQLTGLANRKLFVDRLEEALDAPDVLVGLLALDLDGFKVVNDQQGHLVGDSVLVEVAGAIQKAATDDALVARWGGDEFLVLVTADPARSTPSALEAELDDLADRIRGGLEEATSALGAPVGASSGGIVAQPGERIRHLLRRADEAMYAQKATRRRRRTD